MLVKGITFQPQDWLKDFFFFCEILVENDISENFIISYQMQNSNALAFLNLETFQILSYLLCYAFNDLSFTLFFSSSFFSCIRCFMWSNKLHIFSIHLKPSVPFYNWILYKWFTLFMFSKCIRILYIKRNYDKSTM